MVFINQISKLLYFSLIICVSAKCSSNEVDSSQNFEAQSQTNNSSLEQLFDFDDIMTSCNESFRTTLDYLREFNATGKFPDETDKTPMCYIRCYFEKLGIIEGGNINRTKIVEMWPKIADSVDICQQQGEAEQNPCIASYEIISCLMARDLVDSKK